VIGGLNFKGARNRFTKKSSIAYFIDRNGDLYRDGVADFGVTLNGAANGAIVRRLEKILTHVFVDEAQDLVGYDLDVLDLLLASQIRVMLVGDPRQHTFATNCGNRNSKYRGVGLVDWFRERSAACPLEQVTCSYRCCQQICDFADAIYPDLPTTTSVGVSGTGHDGVFQVCVDDVDRYLSEFNSVTILRYDKIVNTKGLPALNIGVVKGSTFDRVMIFPTKPMLEFLGHREPKRLKSPEKLYVAITRARFSAVFVVPKPVSGSVPIYRCAF
jgi:DNA helicase IV